jgi:hypothetical protein
MDSVSLAPSAVGQPTAQGRVICQVAKPISQPGPLLSIHTQTLVKGSKYLRRTVLQTQLVDETGHFVESVNDHPSPRWHERPTGLLAIPSSGPHRSLVQQPTGRVSATAKIASACHSPNLSPFDTEDFCRFFNWDQAHPVLTSVL